MAARNLHRAAQAQGESAVRRHREPGRQGIPTRQRGLRNCCFRQHRRIDDSGRYNSQQPTKNKPAESAEPFVFATGRVVELVARPSAEQRREDVKPEAAETTRTLLCAKWTAGLKVTKVNNESPARSEEKELFAPTINARLARSANTIWPP